MIPHGSLALSTAETIAAFIAHLGTHRGLRELRGGEQVVADAVGGLGGIHHLHVEDAVDRHGDVVLRDAFLRGNVDGLLLEGVLVGDLVEEGNENVEAGVEGAAVFAEALDYVRRLLGDYHRCLHDRDEHDESDYCEKHKTWTHFVVSLIVFGVWEEWWRERGSNP